MVDLWLGRFCDPEVISETSAFRVVACVDSVGDQRATVVAAASRAQREPAQAALMRLFEAHRDPAHPIIARAVEHGDHGGTPFVVFDFPARLDFDQLLQVGLEGGWKAPYGLADGFSTTLRDAIIASSARIDPATGRAPCLGRFAHGNVLFAANGRHVLIGYGHNIIVDDEFARIVVSSRFFQAPEVAVGGQPTPSSDLVAMIEMTRATMAFVDVSAALGRVLIGNTVREDLELARLVLRFETRVMRGAPARRPPIPDIVRASNRIRELVGSVPDPEGFRDFVERLLADTMPQLAGGQHPLRIAQDGSWFELGPARTELSRNRLLGRLLRVLAQERVAVPGRTLSVDALMDAGWPGEKMQREAGQNRVYVAIAALRRAGLAGHLERDGGGYRLRPALRVEFADS